MTKKENFETVEEYWESFRSSMFNNRTDEELRTTRWVFLAGCTSIYEMMMNNFSGLSDKTLEEKASLLDSIYNELEKFYNEVTEHVNTITH